MRHASCIERSIKEDNGHVNIDDTGKRPKGSHHHDVPPGLQKGRPVDIRNLSIRHKGNCVNDCQKKEERKDESSAQEIGTGGKTHQRCQAKAGVAL